ncbi:MAG: NADH-quinone oxidoreductase subunit J, partial [Planctomycetales bacterium]|nr:NADH-quinone oxidoreductase subunit J [Planctomycetales bacterium]
MTDVFTRTMPVASAWLLGEATAATKEGWGWLLAAAFLVYALWEAMPSGKLPTTARRVRVAISGFVGLVLLWYHVPRMGQLPMEVGFVVFALITLVAAVATISSRSPMYCAIWFAVTLLGTAALMMMQGAQFLGIATVAVYAGAIVVTFLFVLMLSQPEGHSFYDRISWGSAPRFLGSLIATLLIL